MPSVKRKLAELEKERAKIRKTNHSIASFVVVKESESSPLDSTTHAPQSVECEPITQSETVQTPVRRKAQAKHKIGFDESWKDTRPWLYVKNDQTENGSAVVMYCKLCQKHKTKGMNGSVTWNEKGCATLRHDKVLDHEQSEMHRTAIHIETEVQLDISSAFREERLPMGENEFRAVTCAAKILHFLIIHNIPHTTVFKDLVNFATKELQCPDLQYLKKGNNATHTSNTTAQELMDSMVEDIEETLHERINRSPGYAIMNDETSDVSNKKHLAFCVKYIDNDSGEACVDYLKDVRVNDGKAETIFNETKTVIEDLSVDKFVAYASDGCNTMIGKKTGVATRLKEMKPEIVTVHCHNHRLALAAKDSFESIKVMRDTDDLLGHIFKYYHYSSNRTSSLERLQKLLDDSGTRKLKQVAHTRWLSHQDAVTSLRDTYQAVIMDLENAIEAGNDRVRIGSGPSANGLAKKLKTYESVHIIHFLCDALKPMTTLAMTFEKNDIDLSVVKPRKEAAISALNKLKDNEGISMKKAKKILSENGIEPTEKQVESVKKAEHQFVNNLIEQIERRLEASDIIDNMSVFNMEDTSAFYGNDEVASLAEHFEMDPNSVVEEWDTLKNTVSNVEQNVISGPSKLMKVFSKVKHFTGNSCDNLEKIFTAAAVLPVSTAEVERVFSEVNRTKIDIRNRLDVTTVHQLLMIHRNEKYLNFEKTVKRWHGKKPRRI